MHELTVVPELADQTSGWLVGDLNYWKPTLTTALAPTDLTLLAPLRWATRDPRPGFAALVRRLRYRIDPVFGQFLERCAVTRVWARDSWHRWSWLLRKVLMHTLAVLSNCRQGNPPLQLARLVA